MPEMVQLTMDGLKEFIATAVPEFQLIPKAPAGDSESPAGPAAKR